MKKPITLFVLCMLAFLYVKVNAQKHTHEYEENLPPEEIQHRIDHPAPPHRTCGTMDSWEIEKQKDPDFEKRMQQIELEMEEWIKNNQDNIRQEGGKLIVTIPVVVHVIWNTSTQNISDAKIMSQINVLNKDYRKLNTDTTNVPAAFKPVLADVEFEFCLAKRDPNGLPTTGITRTQTTKTSFAIETNDAKFTAQGGHDIWNRNNYLNLWVVPAITSGGQPGILGYAQFPGGSATTDGVVIGYNYFGTLAPVTSPYNKGRTATHEIGHWFNLRHIWGDDGTACTGTDYCADTPNQAGENYGCPTFPKTDACSPTAPGVMFMNYMDYVNDACMYMFTNDQKTRMWAALNTSRAGLKTSLGCQAVTVLTATPTATTFCPGETGTVNFTQTGTMNPGNVYTVELSDANGNFNNPTVIGTRTSQLPGAITVTYPNDAVGGTNYKIRVVSSDPITTTSVSSSSITIRTPMVQTVTDLTFCNKYSFEISATTQFADSLIWTTSGSGTFGDDHALTTNYTPSEQDTLDGFITLTATAYNSCGSRNIPVSVHLIQNPVIYVSENKTICFGESVNLNATGADTYLWSPADGLNDVAIANPIANPTVTTTYTVSGTSNCGIDSKDVVVFVNDLPTSGLAESDTTCINESLVITATPGYASYLWSTNATTNAITVNSVNAGTINYTVTITSSAGCTAIDSISVFFDPCLFTKHTKQLPLLVSCQPNPTNGILNLQFNKQHDDIFVEVLNIQGIVISKEKVSQNQSEESYIIDLSSYPKGVYIVKVYNQSQQQINKIVFY